MFSELFVRGLRLARELPEDSYLAAIPAIRQLQREALTLTKPVTFFVGENGTGKSTLLEAAAVGLGFNPEGGTVNFRFSTRDTHSGLGGVLTVVRGVKRPLGGFFLRAESFYNALTYIDSDPELLDLYGGEPMHARSHGETFLSMVELRFRGGGLYLIDEPEAALSPMKLLELMVRIDALAKDGAQFLIATHSPILMCLPGAEVLSFSEEGIRSVDPRETAHFQMTKSFLDAPERMLRYLLKE